MKSNKEFQRTKARSRIRSKVSGTLQRPRLSVFRSNKFIYAQLIDDSKGNTLVSASSKEDSITSKNINKVEQAKLVGALIAERALEAQISEVVFDRGGYVYHGRVKTLADGAREGGLKF